LEVTPFKSARQPQLSRTPASRALLAEKPTTQ